MVALRAINSFYHILYRRIRTLYRSIRIRKWYVKHSTGGSLTREQKEEIIDFYKPYQSVSTCFHAAAGGSAADVPLRPGCRRGPELWGQG